MIISCFCVFFYLKSVDELTASKEKAAQKHEEEIRRMKQSSNGIQEKLMTDHRLVVDAANQRHAQELSTERLQAETKLTRVKEVSYYYY